MPHFHQNPFWPKQIWLQWWIVNTQVLLCWDKATLCMYVQSWMHTWCGRGGAVAGFLPQTCICSVLCALKPCTHKNQAELSPGSPSACQDGLWSLKLLLDVWIAISVWCYHCQLYQKCVNRTPPHGPNSSLARWPIFFFFGLGKRADSKFIFVQQHPCAWLLGPTVKGLERNTTGAGIWGFEAWRNCCPGRIEVLKSNFFSGASFFWIILSLYCSFFLYTYTNINRIE